MIDERELERRLREWADEFRGGRYEQLGYSGNNLIATLIAHKGFVPTGGGHRPVPTGTPADEIEAIVMQMEECGLRSEAQVLRIEYFQARLPLEAKLQRLRRVGQGVAKSAYYRRLRMAQVFIWGRLAGSDLPALARAELGPEN